MYKNPIRARARIDAAPCSHPTFGVRRTQQEFKESREELFLLNARLQKKLGAVDYTLCQLRESGLSWNDIAGRMEILFGGDWSAQRAASRTKRARVRHDNILDQIESAGGGTP